MSKSSSILLLNKEEGITSFASLGPIKRLIDPKVGHAGTLDRFATGLMIVLTGQLTKLNTLFTNLDKKYLATIRFGSETETLDPDGQVIDVGSIPSIKEIEEVLKTQFIGKIEQQPPQYSAIHIQGERAYRLARKGQRVSMPSRQVEIFSTKIINWDERDLEVEIHCSKGTYIRSIARDLALACNSRGHLHSLQRIAIGPYLLDEAVDSTDYTRLRHHAEDSSDRLLRLPNIGKIVIDEKSSERFCFGNLPSVEAIVDSDVENGDTHAALFSKEGSLMGVAALDQYKVPVKVVAVACSRGS